MTDLEFQTSIVKWMGNEVEKSYPKCCIAYFLYVLTCRCTPGRETISTMRVPGVDHIMCPQCRFEWGENYANECYINEIEGDEK